MNLGIVPERLKMADALHRVLYCLLVHNISDAKLHRNLVSVPDQAFQNLNLYSPHHLSMNLSQLFIPDQMKLWVLFFQLP